MCFVNGCGDRKPPRPPEPDLKNPMTVFLQSGNSKKCIVMEIIGPLQESMEDGILTGNKEIEKLMEVN
jgi:hypothetical protein